MVSFDSNNIIKIIDPILKRNIDSFVTEKESVKIIIQNQRLITVSILPELRTKSIYFAVDDRRQLIDYDFDELRKDDDFRIAYKTLISRVMIYKSLAAKAKKLDEILLPILVAYRADKEIMEVPFQ